MHYAYYLFLKTLCWKINSCLAGYLILETIEPADNIACAYFDAGYIPWSWSQSQFLCHYVLATTQFPDVNHEKLNYISLNKKKMNRNTPTLMEKKMTSNE